MGYETRLHIGYASDIEAFKHEGRTYLFEVARVDLSKAGYTTQTGQVLDQARQEATETFFWYGDDGNGRVTEDAYGDPLTPVPWDALVSAMRADQQREPYRRFTVALSLLTGFKPDEWWDQHPVVVQYGH